MTATNQPVGSQTIRQVLLGLLLLFAIIVVVETTRSFNGHFSWSYGTWIDVDERGMSVQENDGRNHFRAELEGDVRFSVDETAIEHLGPGAWLELEEDGRGGHRRLEARPGAGGAPELRFWLDGKRQEGDAAARAWLATAIPRLLRASGADVEGRVARFLAQGGAPAVLAEIELVQTDAVQRSYFEQLFAQAQVAGEDLASALRIAEREIGTDAEMAEILGLVPAARLDTPELRRRYVRAAETIGTDAELRRTLETLVADPTLDAHSLDVVLGVATTIGTDAELADLLAKVAKSYAPDRPLPPSFGETLATIGTDAEHRRVLATAFKRPLLGAEELDALLVTATQIGTDAELAEALETLLAARPQGWVPPPSFFTAVETIGTQAERERVLAAVASP